jgi:hypothetical protein
MKKLNAKEVVDFFGSVNSSLFLSLDNYVNQSGEIANHLVQLNIDRSKLAQKALTKLNAVSFPESDIKEIARLELIKSIVSPNETRSKAQTDAFIRLNKNVQFCPNTRQISIFGGQRLMKKVIVKGEYKTVNSKPLTIAKNELVKDLKISFYFNPARFNLDLSKFTIYKYGKNKIKFIAKP